MTLPAHLVYKFCPNKKCTQHNVLKVIDAAEKDAKTFCSKCAQRMNLHTAPTPAESAAITPAGANGDTPPVKGDISTQTSLVPTTSPASVKRFHRTAWNIGKKRHICWCNWEGDYAASIEHEKSEPMWITEEEAREVASQGWSGGVGYRGTGFGVVRNDVPPRGANDTFTCDDVDVRGCPIYTPEQSPIIEIPVVMWEKWFHLARRFDTEWLAYLIGAYIEPEDNYPTGCYKITDMWFPRQRVTSAHVTVNDEDLRNLRPGTIGDVHSHVGMAAYFSGEDERHFNHDVHIVINRREEFATSIRGKLQCGKTTRNKASKVMVTGIEPDPLEVELRSKFETSPPVATSSPATSPHGGSTELITKDVKPN